MRAHSMVRTAGLLGTLELLSACGGGGGGGAEQPQARPPTVSISLDSASLKTRETTTLRWSSTGATACTASGSWSGDRATAGTLDVGSSSAGSLTYRLECTNADGARSAAATLSVRSRTAADYFRLDDTGLVIRNDNANTARSTHAIGNLDLNADGMMDSILLGPEFEPGAPATTFNRQSVHVLLGGATPSSGAALFPGGRPSYVVSNFPLLYDFNGDGRSDLFLPEFGADRSPFEGGQSGAWLSGTSGYLATNLQPATAALHGASAGRVAGMPAVFAQAVCCGDEKIPFLYLFSGGSFSVNRALLPTLVTDTDPGGNAQRLWTASAIADLDQDGIDDLVLGAFAAVRPDDPLIGNYVVFGTSAGWRDGTVLRLPDPQGIAITDLTALNLSVADLDGDGRKDIVLGYTNRYATRGIQILRNAGARTLVDVSASMLGAGEINVSGCPGTTLPVIDINGDQCPDIVEPELTCASSGSSRGRLLLNDCNGAFVKANGALASVLSQLPDVSMLPFTDHQGRISWYLPVAEAATAASGGFGATRYRRLTNLANLPTPANGSIVLD